MTTLDRVQASLDQLGDLIEASRRDPESVGGHNDRRTWRVSIEVSLHGEQHDDGTTERWASVNGGDGMNAEDTRKLAHLLMQVANKMDAAATGCATCRDWSASGGTAIV